MPQAVFTHAESSAYDDLLEKRYHFPRTYLDRVRQVVGDLVVFYEPRRHRGAQSSGGRQAYFAVARVTDIVADPHRADHHYALIEEYLEFDREVPFRVGDKYFESALRKPDGSTNKGSFGHSVRLLERSEFVAIVQTGFSREREPWEQPSSPSTAEPLAEFPERPIVTQVLQRPFRDQAFRRRVREAYSNTCAVSGLRLINGGGRPEVQAAHIQPVAEKGSDSVRNGVALTSTIHWLFDRGLISISEDHRILVSSRSLPDAVVGLLPGDRKLRLPARKEHWPHPTYLAWHRSECFKP